MKVTAKQYSQTLFELTDNKSEQEVFDIVLKFAETLKKDSQLKNVQQITEKYVEFYNAAHKIVVTEVCVRRDLSPVVLEKIKDFMKKKYSAKEVEIKVVVDEKIKGGIIIRVGDEVLDGSVGGKLERLKRELIK